MKLKRIFSPIPPGEYHCNMGVGGSSSKMRNTADTVFFSDILEKYYPLHSLADTIAHGCFIIIKMKYIKILQKFLQNFKDN